MAKIPQQRKIELRLRAEEVSTVIDLAAAGFIFGGMGGAVAYLFTMRGLATVMRGDASLEVVLLMMVCALIFLIAYQAGAKSTARHYDFDKHWHGRRMIFDHDPTIDLEARRPPDNPAEGYKLSGEGTEFDKGK